jgi:endoglycosylceramidase
VNPIYSERELQAALVSTGATTVVTLTPFYQRIVDAIRKVDHDGWIFLEPQSLGVNQGTDTSLGKVNDPRPGGPRLVLAPHFYPGGVDLGGGYTGLAKLLVLGEMAAWKGNMRAASARLGMPLWIGEVGGMSVKSPGAVDYTRDWLAMADEMRIGWAYWSNDPGDTGAAYGDGRPTAVGAQLSRPYPRAIAGIPTRISYASAALTVAWRERAGVSGPTEIWLPPKAFPGEPQVSSSDPTGTWRSRWDGVRRVLSVWADPNSPVHTVMVR